jgi:hypothetical protein
MTREIGWLQREILETLEDAKAAPVWYKGGRAHVPYADRPGIDWEPGWVMAGGSSVRLPDRVYDLRASCRFLAERHGKTHTSREERHPPTWVDTAFQASFSRAVRTLVRRGALQWCDHRGQPVEPWEVRLVERQRRFVRLAVS